MKYLTLTIVFEGENLNYGESFGNVLSLKKISSRGGNYSYVSRQALRYDIVRMLNENFDVPLTPVDKAAKVVQFTEDATIADFPEIDFFGYMKTGVNKIRKAVIRLTDAISLEPYNNDLDFSTNKGLADRNEETKNNNDIFQAEFHKSFYSYTITADLDKIGIDTEYSISLETDEKIKRLNMFLDCVKLLNRDIRGKRENLAPVFAIGGIYDVGNPFFYNRIELIFTKDKRTINERILNSELKKKAFIQAIGEQTYIGSIDSIFDNIDAINIAEKNKLDIEDLFETVKAGIKKYYIGE